MMLNVIMSECFQSIICNYWIVGGSLVGWFLFMIIGIFTERLGVSSYSVTSTFILLAAHCAFQSLEKGYNVQLSS